jgi:thiamine monophosphate kinase
MEVKFSFKHFSTWNRLAWKKQNNKNVEKEGSKDATYIYNLTKRHTVVTMDTLNVTGLNLLEIE